MLKPLFNKVAGLKTVTPTKVFSCEYYEILKNIYFEEHLSAAGSASSTCPKIPATLTTLKIPTTLVPAA